MKLTDLHPQFVFAGGPGVFNSDGSPAPYRTGVGLGFDCPCGCGHRCYVGFSNPIDGGPALRHDAPRWERKGETFECMTLRPSIQRLDGCRWHGFITNGQVETA